ncbi:LPD7 domain-containing protein [Acidithiobacillus caldus]
MAAELDHIFSYGPLDVVAANDDQARGLHVRHEDAQMTAFIPSDDPLHREILKLVEKNPHSLGFVANQIHARLDQEGRWSGPSLDDEGINFGPSRDVERQLEVENPAPGEPGLAEELLENKAGQDRSAEPAPLAAGPVMPMKAGVSVVKAQEHPEPENEPAKDQGLSTGSPKSEEKAAQSADLPVPDPLDAQQPETSPEAAEPAKEEGLTKDWPGSPATAAPAPEQKTPEPETARVFPKKSPPEVLLADPKRGKALVLDHGDRVSVTNRALLGIGREAEERRNKSVEVALRAAKERFGEPVRFSGSRAFEEKTIEMAVRLGIQLEPATEHGKRAYEKALEARNTLGSSVNRAPAKQKTVEKGIGL